MKRIKMTDFDTIIVEGQAGYGMSCAMLSIIQKYHDMGYKIINLPDSKNDVKEI